MPERCNLFTPDIRTSQDITREKIIKPLQPLQPWSLILLALREQVR